MDGNVRGIEKKDVLGLGVASPGPLDIENGIILDTINLKIFQNYNLLANLSVFDNIAFVLKLIGINDKKKIEERVNYILKAVNMYPFRKKKGLQLSGGQQQRVAIARALVKNPKVIIADEPTGNLDSKNTLDIMNIIKQISREKLVILVTHEKELAQFYGDRIIELRDGLIVNDYQNSEAQDHDIKADDTIYLQDLTNLSNLNDGLVNIKSFSDSKAKTEPISIQLIVKNRTLYLDVKSSHLKVKLLDESAGITIKKGKYVKKTRKELIKTSFDHKMLDNTETPRQRKALVSLKQTFLMALYKVVSTSKKGKLMLFGFLMSGAIIALTIATLANVLIVDPEIHMQNSKGNLSIHKIRIQGEETITFDELLAYQKPGDDSFYINANGWLNLGILNPNGSISHAPITGQVELVERVGTADLLIGRMPLSDNEILVSKSIADAVVKSSNGQGIGIWSFEHLLRETLVQNEVELKIVGIVDTEISLIYMTRLTAAHTSSLRMTQLNKVLPYESFSDAVLEAGQMPQERQIVISESRFFDLTGGNDYSGEWPRTIPQMDSQVSGVHSIENGDLIQLATLAHVERNVFENSFDSLYVYSSDHAALLTELEARDDIEAADIYKEAYQNARINIQITLWSTVGTSAFIIGFALLGFYFVIRSSLISRIYEISVYRALGVRKNDIFRSFIVEIFVLTTISTLVGYTLAIIGLLKLQESLIGDFNLITVTPLTIIGGLVLLYTLNIIAGLSPVYFLLRKTPSQILSQYDI